MVPRLPLLVVVAALLAAARPNSETNTGDGGDGGTDEALNIEA